MDFAGRYQIPAPPEVVWAALNDPEILKACIPGCQSLDKTDATHFDAVATLKIGPVKATFKAKLALENLDPPHRCSIKGEGQGGVAGFAKGEADVLIEAQALTYAAKANIGGKLAQVGQRLIDGAAKQIADDFFSRFVGAIGAASAEEAAAVASAANEEALPLDVEPPPMVETEPVAPVPTPGKREGLAPEIWIVGLIAVIVILLVLFGVSL